MTRADRSVGWANHLIHPDEERAIVLSLIHSFQETNPAFDTNHATNLYVSLKTTPLAIIMGVENSGKLAAVQLLAKQIIENAAQIQMMVGHPFWASNSDNVALFTEAQTRFNTEKVLSLIHEAWKPKNTHRLYLGCLARISLGELEAFFSSAAFQLGHGELMALPYAHFNEPIPFPPNLLLIGTIEGYPTYYSKALLSQASLIHWPNSFNIQADFYNPVSVPVRRQAEFLRQRIRSSRPARIKLSRIIGWNLPGLALTKDILSLLEVHNTDLPSYVIDNILTYLANAWSRDDVGLFSMSTKENLSVALDFALAQYLLPHIVQLRSIPFSVFERIGGILEKNFPHAYSLMTILQAHDRRTTIQESGRDPVCGMTVHPSFAAGRSEVNGKVYHFCSLVCKQAFDSLPEQYT